MTAGDGLRELPPEQEVRTSTWSRLRLVPLCVLLVLVLVATVGGLVWRAQHPTGVLPESTAPVGETLPAACTPDFDRQTTSEPWQGDSAESSEAIWQEHADEVAGMYLEGEDGQLFLGEPHWHNLSQAVGRQPLSDERLEAWHAYINDMRSSLDEQGVDLLVVFAPAKWEIEHDALPAWMQDLRGESRLDQLMAAYPDLPIVDVRAAMAAADATDPVYAPTNSHWTPYGAYAAYGTIADCIAATQGQDVVVPPIASVSYAMDVEEFSSYGWQGEVGTSWTEPEFQVPLGEMALTTADGSSGTVPIDTQIDMLELPATTDNADATTDLDVLYVRDSTGNAMGPLLQDAFSSTTQIRHFVDDPASMPDVPLAAAEADSDVAILMITERFLDVVPGVGAVP